MFDFTEEELEKLYGKMVEERPISIEGIKKKVTFKIYDGLAYGMLDDKEYIITYPKLEFIEDSVEMQEEIREKLNMKDGQKIAVFDVLQVFNKLDIDGTRVRWNDKTQRLEEEKTWLLEVPVNAQ